MLPTWCRQSIVRIRPVTTEQRGSVIFDWDNADELTINGCSMQPAGTSLSQDGRVQGIMDGYTCYTPMNADIQACDRIRYGGSVYTITGEPRVWESPTGAVSHLILNLEAYHG